MSTKSRYHHGALREELMRASLELIESEGLAAVSLRRVAREAGVSPGAPYHHFADRAALMTALSTQGFELLRAELRTARDRADTPMSRLAALADAYVRFARERPAHFRLMFRPELSRSHKHPETSAAGDAAFAVLAETVAEAAAAGTVPTDEADILAMTWWSLAHGLASLTLDGKLPDRAAQLGMTVPDLSDRVTRLFADLVDSTRSRP
ncbi:TetR/AcrR family transcriptional regulator [Nocardia sp. CC227C]|uniref:TetR/AcrR family transcriptional regulator n=1 Tax=Nocardia sp. CC227C TaxID=3044562 RepID=UPI00278C44C3|nr:TetR/AcrR family transcriptional regulator [Nocardia sp. CC227C]